MATFTDNMDLEKPSEGASGAGESINDNSDKIEFGRTWKATYGATIAAFRVVYFDEVTGKILEAQALGTAVRWAFGLTLEAGVLNDQKHILWYGGPVVNGSWGFSGAGPVWLSDSTAGAVTESKPATDHIVIGQKLSATSIRLDIHYMN